MRLRKALKYSRYFYYQGDKFFALIYPKEKFWGKKAFTVVACKHPLGCDDYIDLSSNVVVKPVIRENAKATQKSLANKPENGCGKSDNKLKDI